MTWRVFQPAPTSTRVLADADRYLVASIRIPAVRTGARRHGATVTGDEATCVLRAREPAGGARPPAVIPARRAPLDVLRSTSRRGSRRALSSRRGDGPGQSPRPSGRGHLRRSGVLCRARSPARVGTALRRRQMYPLDPAVEPTAVIVNMKFLERRGMHPQRAIGTRIRSHQGTADGSAPGPWREIVGVVPNIEPSEDRAFRRDAGGLPCPRGRARSTR